MMEIWFKDMSGKWGALLFGGVCGAVSGFIGGAFYSVVVLQYLNIVYGLSALAFGLLPGGVLGYLCHSNPQASPTRRWVKLFFFLGLILAVPLGSILIYATVFGFIDGSESQPVINFILIIGWIVLSGGVAGIVGGWVGGTLFNWFR
jgi:hypothetical protein